MTLNVTSSDIRINTSKGELKFSSSEPLLFISGIETNEHEIGYMTVDGTAKFVAHNQFFLDTPLLPNEVGALYITITSLTGFGQPGESFVGVRQPANSVIPIYVRGHAQNNVPALDTTQMSIAPIFNNEITDGTGYTDPYRVVGYEVSLLYYPTNATKAGNYFVSGNQGVSNPTINFTWELYRYRFLQTT